MNARFKAILNHVKYLCCGNALQQERLVNLSKDWVIGKASQIGFSDEEITDALIQLSQEGDIVVSELSPTYSLSRGAFDTFLQENVKGYYPLKEQVVAELGNAAREGRKPESTLIAQKLQRPPFVIEHILQVLDAERRIGTVQPIGGPLIVTWIAPELKYQ